ncbi:MAG: hypothetical protein JST85_24355 [Acidobacteria bacterium]|nr:hypothetical protein [Acidobacteriota bacterium]
MRDILETIWNIFIRSAACGFILFLVFLGHNFQIPAGCSQSSQQNQSVSEWALTLVNAAIWWAWHDVLWLNQRIFEWWSGFCSPLIKFGVLFGSVLFAQYFLLLLKGTILKNKLSVYCPIDNLPGRPIPGTVDRYRCPDGHQFAGEPHDFHYV